jgi:polyhydroxyalkanoate synthesis regulator phasin
MKLLIVALAISALAGCGVETATTAATGAAIKKKELEEGKRTQERAKQKIDQAMDQAQQRAQQADDAAGR